MLVAKGFSQTPKVDFDRTFSLVVKFESICAILVIVTRKDIELLQFDIKTTFFHKDLAKNIYMKQPLGFEYPSVENKVCRLLKSLYVLKQASCQWNAKFNEFLLKYDFRSTLLSLVSIILPICQSSLL